MNYKYQYSDWGYFIDYTFISITQMRACFELANSSYLHPFNSIVKTSNHVSIAKNHIAYIRFDFFSFVEK